MMRWILALVLLLSALPALAQTPTRLVYVTPSGSGGGSSWADASSLQSALANAEPGDAILVASGTYVPSDLPGRPASFRISSAIVGVYGGWNGSESVTPGTLQSTLALRDFSLNETVLSGDRAGNDVVGSTSTGRGDNSYHVVRVTSSSALSAGRSDGNRRAGRLDECVLLRRRRRATRQGKCPS